MNYTLLFWRTEQSKGAVEVANFIVVWLESSLCLLSFGRIIFELSFFTSLLKI
jgi:hypothetical protein